MKNYRTRSQQFCWSLILVKQYIYTGQTRSGKTKMLRKGLNRRGKDNNKCILFPYLIGADTCLYDDGKTNKLFKGKEQ